MTIKWLQRSAARTGWMFTGSFGDMDCGRLMKGVHPDGMNTFFASEKREELSCC